MIGLYEQPTRKCCFGNIRLTKISFGAFHEIAFNLVLMKFIQKDSFSLYSDMLAVCFLKVSKFLTADSKIKYEIKCAIH